MGTGVVSHDTELMRSWSNTMGDNSNEYQYSRHYDWNRDP